VAHACNPSYSEGRYQEDRGSKPALGRQFERSYLEALSSNPSTKKKSATKKKKKEKQTNTLFPNTNHRGLHNYLN
jgi:hypothetical protein